MAAQDAFNPGQEAATVTAAPNIQAVQARYDPNGSANALATALGSKSTQASLENFQQVYDQRKLQEQSLKIDGYTQQFMDDGVGGAVSQAQLKQRFPEMVPVIAARVAESIGRKQGALDVAGSIEYINGRDDLRLDTAARAAYVAKSRAELFAKIQPGNDFYAAGVVSAMDRAFGQEEQKWQSQTATYHQEVQRVALSDEVTVALNSADPKAMLEFTDGNYAKSASLNNLERNKVYVDTTIKLAATSDDPTILDRLPQRYLNAESKAQIYQAKLAVTNQQWAKFTRAKEFEAYQREEQTRTGKIDILTDLSSGKTPDLAKLVGNPTLHAFGVSAMETPQVPEASSQAVVQAFKTKLLDSSNFASLGSQADLTKAAFSIQGINPNHRAALIAEIPKLMEGAILMNDPIVTSAFKNQIGYRLDDLMKSPNAALQQMLNQTNLRGVSMGIFEDGVRRRYMAHQEDNGEWPKGHEARLYVNEAVAETSAYIDKASSLSALAEMTTKPATPAATPKATPSASSKPTPSASKAPTKTPIQLELERRANAK